MTELSPEAKGLFEASRDAMQPDEARLARAGDALAKRIAGDGGVGEAPGGFAQSLSTVHWVGISLALVATGTFIALTRDADEAEAITTRTHTEATAPVSAAAEPSSPRDAVRMEVVTDESRERKDKTSNPIAASETAEPSPGPTRKSAATSERTLTHERRSVRAPARPTFSTRLETPQGTVATLPSAPASTSDLEPATPSIAQEVLVAPDDPALANELVLMRRARAALDRNDAKQTLELLEHHASRYPRGTLYQERLALRVLALCALGRTDQVEAASLELERAAPRSPHWMRINRACKPGGGRPGLR